MPKVSKPKLSAYTTAPWPDEVGQYRPTGTMLNLQTCSCGHDRLSHSNFLGAGKDRQVITDCPNAGLCRVGGCTCPAFVYSEEHTSEEGRRHRAAEVKQFTVVPPAAK